MNKFKFVDINKGEISNNIDLIFPEWKGGEEKVCVFSPHDDDAILGAGYGILSALQNNAEVFIFIFCSGNAGYSRIEEKTTIVETRRRETMECYRKLGVKKENIIRFDYSDFSSMQYVCWELDSGKEGCFKKVITKMREIKATRLLMPNGYKEHIDHKAVHLIGTYFVSQAGDQVVVDWAIPHKIDTALEYSVWADFSPEDSIVSGRERNLRANRIILANEKAEGNIYDAVLEYHSQEKIIESLREARRERKTDSGDFMEVYVASDLRPKLDYSPYVKFIKEIEA